MRIGELGRRAGVPVPTIKYYLREGLLSYGEASAPNQVHYDERHLRRLRLIRSLVEVGGLSIARTRDVLDAVDDPGRSAFKALGVVHHAVSGDGSAADRAGATGSGGAHEAAADGVVDELLRRHGWEVGAGNPGRVRLAELLGVLEGLGQAGLLAYLDDYAGLADRLARVDMDVLAGQQPDGPDAPDARLEALVLATVLGDQLLTTLRHLAQTHVARDRFADDPTR